MVQALGKIKRHWTPLDLAYSKTISGPLNQIYNAVYQSYDPDRRLVPLEILIPVEAIDPKRNITPGIINSKLTDVRWYENSVSEANNILDSNTAYVIDRNGASNNRGKLIVKKNTPLEGLVLIFTAKYTDPRNGKVVNISDSVPLGVTVSTDEPLRVKVDYPFGQVVDPTEERDFVQIDNMLFMGENEYEGSIYTWQKKTGANHETLTEGQDGIVGTFSSKLRVPCPAVGKRMDLRCIADVLPDLTGINLISKKMISDDWNAISASSSTLGQDADGKYIQLDTPFLGHIPGVETLSNIIPTDDVFQGKIKYKNKQSYRLSIRSKKAGSAGGIIFRIVFTDGTTQNVNADTPSLTINSVITSADKTIRNIFIYIGSHGLINIYDIQLVEYHGANNLANGGSYKRVPSTGIASDNAYTSLPISQNIANSISPGNTATITIGSVKVLSGNASYITVALYTGTNYSSGQDMNATELKKTITMINNPNSSPAQLIVYAGKYGSIAGNAIEVRNVMLTIGSTAYKYSPADGEFIPAIPDGAPRPSTPSSKAIITDHVLSTSYPDPKLKRHVPDLVLDDTSLIPGFVTLKSNRGDIVNPQHYWSFPWKDKTGAIFARGSQILIDSDKFENDEFEYEVQAVEGQGEAKWAAKFNGIDQCLSYSGVIRNSTPVKNKTYEITFKYDRALSINQYLIYNVRNDSSYAHRFIFSIKPDSKILILTIKNDSITDYTQQWYTSNQSLVVGKMYKIIVRFDSNGILTNFKINGTEETCTLETMPGGIGGGSAFMLSYYSASPAAITLLDFKYIHLDTELLLHYDFQPLNGNRNNMLKNKNDDGSALVNNGYTLIPVNISNLNDPNPATGFFTTI